MAKKRKEATKQINPNGQVLRILLAEGSGANRKKKPKVMATQICWNFLFNGIYGILLA